MYGIAILYLVKEPGKELFFRPFPKQEILDSPIPKGFADDNFKFDENGRKFTQMGRKYFFSRSGFKRLKLQTYKNQGLFVNGLTVLHKLAV